MEFDSIFDDKKTQFIIEESIEDKYFDEFVTEVLENLSTIENDLKLLKSDKSKKQIINRIFRKIHTIKGLSGFVSYNIIENLSHNTEEILNSIRKNKLKINDSVIFIIYEVSELIKKICENKPKEITQSIKDEIIEIELKLKFRTLKTIAFSHS